MLDYIKIILNFIQGIAWPLTVGISLYWLRKPIIDAFGRADKIAIHSKGIELTLNQLEKTISLSAIQRKELSGLTSNEIWGLYDIVKGRLKSNAVSDLNPALKVVVRTLLDVGLVEIFDDNGIRRIRANQLASKLIEIADNLV